MRVSWYPDDESRVLTEIMEYIEKSGNKRLYSSFRLYLEEFKKDPNGINKNIKNNTTKKIDDNLYEIRIEKLRILYTFHNDTYWLISWFKKETQKTPIQEITKAKRIIKEITKE